MVQAMSYGLKAATAPRGIDIRASGVTLVGNVHTNGDIKINAETAEITGTMEYVTTYEVLASMEFTPSEDNPRQVSVMPHPPLGFNIEEYRPGGKIASSVENYYYVEWCPSSDCMDEFGVVDGHIPDGVYSDHLLLLSNKQTGTPPRCNLNVIKCKGKDATWEGLIYGLGGRIWVGGDWQAFR